jgi:hypothetical protein
MNQVIRHCHIAARTIAMIGVQGLKVRFIRSTN